MNSLKVSFLLICAAGVGLAADHAWSIGKVLDSNARRDIVQTGTTFQANTVGTATANSYGNTTLVSGQNTTTGAAQVHHAVFQDNQVLIQGSDYVYTVDDLTLKAAGLPGHGLLTRAIANRKHGCRMIVGDPIQYEQAKSKLIVQDADGKVCKLDIVRQERVTQNAAIAQ